MPFSSVLSNSLHPQYIACFVFIALISATHWISFAASLLSLRLFAFLFSDDGPFIPYH